MARRVRKFVDRAFAKTVDLDLLRRFLEPHAASFGFAWNELPAEETAKREAIFELFSTADGRFPAQLQFALFNISTLATENGARLLQLHAEERGVELVPREELEGPADGRHLNPRHLALVAWLEHRPVFDRALDAAAFLAHGARLELSGLREGLEPREHEQGARDAFARAVVEYFTSKYQGRYCDIRWYSEDDVARLLVLHGSKASMETAVQKSATVAAG
jgi:hypothetical protein